MTFLNFLISGISLGSIYAIIALGYTMVYGIAKMLNFAHGDVIMIGAYVCFYAISRFELPPLISILLAMAVCTLLGVVIERLAYKPLRSAPSLAVLITAIGVSYFLQNLATVLFGGRPMTFPQIPLFTSVVQLGSVRLQRLALLVPVIAGGLMVLLMFLIKKTKTGMAMRAVARDYDAAALMGIDLNKTIATTFFIGSALAGVGAIMWGMKYPQISPTVGAMPGIKCFIAAVLGGIGNTAGAVLGGLLLGLTEILLVAAWPQLSGFRDAFAFVLLIVVLLVKPTGLLGEKATEKV